MVNWDYADSEHLPNIEECLRHTREEMQRQDGRVVNQRIGIHACMHQSMATLNEWQKQS